MGLHYLTFKGRNLEKGKKLTSIWILNNASMSNMNMVNSVGMDSTISEYARMNIVSYEKYMDEHWFYV